MPSSADHLVKIIHILYSLEMGGAEVLVMQLARMQRSLGHDVQLFAYARLGSIGETLRAEGFSVYVPGEAHPLVTMSRYLRRFLSLRPDVVHCHNPAPTIHASLAAKLAGTRCVVSTRHSLVSPPYDQRAEWKYSAAAIFCNWVVGICEKTCVNLRVAPGARKRKIVRVYNGAAALDLTDSAIQTKREGVFRLLFVGRLAAIKNLETMIRAVAKAVPLYPGLTLWIVGDGSVRTSLEDLCRRLAVSANVVFWGERLDTASFFRDADTFIMSSLSEGLPMSLLQAMSAGLPAILTDVGGMGEVLRRSNGGLLVPVGDVQAMRDAILLLAEDRELCSELSARARVAYDADFTLQKMQEAYQRLYEGSAEA